MGPTDPLRGTTVDWTTVLVGAVFEANGYWPDGGFWCSKLDGDNQFWESWAQVQTAGRFETRGVLLDGEAIFASGVVGSDTPRQRHRPVSFVLHENSAAIDAGDRLAGINDGFSGGAPDLGAIESGCDEPHYGPRPAHEQDRVWPIDCRPSPSPTGIHDPMTRPQEPLFAALHPNVPNPFNPRTRIQFELPHSDAVKLTIHDTLGRRVRTLVSGTHVAGRHQVHWDGRDGGGGSVSSGVYFIRLATSESSLARRIILLR